MLFKEFAPLKEDYKTIIVSITEIEKALVPTPPFVGELEPKKKANTYWVGSLIENLFWSRIQYWQEYAQKQIEITRRMMNPERMKYYSPSGVLDKQFERVYNWLEKIVALAVPYEAIWMYDLRSVRNMVEVHYSWYRVIVSWELDRGIDGVALYDAKSAKKKWNEKEKREFGCYQARFYSRMQFLQNPDLEEIPFSYLVITKQATPQLQDITHIIKRQEAEDFVKDKLYQYLLGVHKWEIETTEWSLERM